MKTMKKLIVLTLVAGAAAAMYGQGTVILSNWENTNLSTTATSNGLVWTNDGRGGIGLWDGFIYNLSLQVLGGLSPTTLTQQLAFFREDLVTAAGDYTGYDVGKFIGTWNEIRIMTAPTATPGGLAWLHVKLWWSAGGPVYQTYEAAKSSGTSFFGEAIFQNPSGNQLAIPPGLPETLTGMPAIVMIVPEPGVFALAGLGLAGLLIFRRRK